jgi:hypothetical protein
MIDIESGSVRHEQAVLSHVLNVRRPGIDESYVLAGLHHVGAGIPADRTRSEYCYLLPAQTYLPTFRPQLTL